MALGVTLDFIILSYFSKTLWLLASSFPLIPCQVAPLLIFPAPSLQSLQPGLWIQGWGTFPSGCCPGLPVPCPFPLPDPQSNPPPSPSFSYLHLLLPPPLASFSFCPCPSSLSLFLPPPPGLWNPLFCEVDPRADFAGSISPLKCKL